MWLLWMGLAQASDCEEAQLIHASLHQPVDLLHWNEQLIVADQGGLQVLDPDTLALHQVLLPRHNGFETLWEDDGQLEVDDVSGGEWVFNEVLELIDHTPGRSREVFWSRIDGELHEFPDHDIARGRGVHLHRAVPLRHLAEDDSLLIAIGPTLSRVDSEGELLEVKEIGVEAVWLSEAGDRLLTPDGALYAIEADLSVRVLHRSHVWVNYVLERDGILYTTGPDALGRLHPDRGIEVEAAVVGPVEEVGVVGDRVVVRRAGRVDLLPDGGHWLGNWGSVTGWNGDVWAVTRRGELQRLTDRGPRTVRCLTQECDGKTPRWRASLTQWNVWEETQRAIRTLPQYSLHGTDAGLLIMEYTMTGVPVQMTLFDGANADVVVASRAMSAGEAGAVVTTPEQVFVGSWPYALPSLERSEGEPPVRPTEYHDEVWLPGAGPEPTQWRSGTLMASHNGRVALGSTFDPLEVRLKASLTGAVQLWCVPDAPPAPIAAEALKDSQVPLFQIDKFSPDVSDIYGDAIQPKIRTERAEVTLSWADSSLDRNKTWLGISLDRSLVTTGRGIHSTESADPLRDAALLDMPWFSNGKTYLGPRNDDAREHALSGVSGIRTWAVIHRGEVVATADARWQLDSFAPTAERGSPAPLSPDAEERLAAARQAWAGREATWDRWLLALRPGDDQTVDLLAVSQMAAEAREAHPLLYGYGGYERLVPIGEALTLQPEGWYGEPGSEELSGVVVLWLLGMHRPSRELVERILDESAEGPAVPVIAAIDRHLLGVDVLEKNDILGFGVPGVALLDGWDPLFSQLRRRSDVVVVLRDGEVVWVAQGLSEAGRVARQLLEAAPPAPRP